MDNAATSMQVRGRSSKVPRGNPGAGKRNQFELVPKLCPLLLYNLEVQVYRRGNADVHKQDPKLQAFTKQLSQLDAAGRKIWETSRFIIDLQSSDETKVDLSQAPQQLKLLTELRTKLRETDVHLRRLDDSKLAGADTSEFKPRLSSFAINVDSSSFPNEMETSPKEAAVSPSSDDTNNASIISPHVSVTEAVVRLNHDVVSEQKRMASKLFESKQRLLAVKQEAQELEAENEKLRKALEAGPDLKALREKVNSLQQQVDEMDSLQVKLEQQSVKIENLPRLMAEVEATRPAAEEARALEKQLQEMKNLDSRRQTLRASINFAAA
eukprot:gene31742-6942_t